MTDLLRIAIVGFGEIAGRQHLPAIAKTSGAAVVAVVDPVKTPPGLPHFRDLQELLRDGPEIDAVALCTPPQARHLQAATALAAGKHVLLEKPLAASTEEASELVRLADEYGRTLMCDHTFCYTPAVQYLRDLVAGGELGDVLFVDSVRINLGLVQPDVDVFWDLAPHDLSILDFVLPGGLRPIGVAAHGADPIGAGVACLGYLSLPLPGGVELLSSQPLSGSFAADWAGHVHPARKLADAPLPDEDDA